ncbi:MAG: hypothetical protein EB027_05790 [Actinobacteria bacterium]|nr:hypothetical protein [Actinomycetota bacterium]
MRSALTDHHGERTGLALTVLTVGAAVDGPDDELDDDPPVGVPVPGSVLPVGESVAPPSG